MSQMYRYGELEVEFNLLDLDEYEKLEKAYDSLQERIKKVPADGKVTDRLRSMLEAYDTFFDDFFGTGATGKMFKGRNLEHRINAMNLITELSKMQNADFGSKVNKYLPNRDQRRANFKNHNKYRK